MSIIYPWQQQTWQQLASYIQQARVPQALLLHGRAGLGKASLVESYVATLLCERPDPKARACGQCDSCVLLAAHTHPDYLRVEPDETGKSIGIDKIRSLIAKLALKPQFAGFRATVITPANALTTAAANAFLKCLEEPTERTCIILIAEHAYKLPATIRSRCQAIALHTPELALSQQWLSSQGIEQAELLLTLTQGAPLAALHYAKQNLLASRQTMFNDWVNVARGKADIVTIAEQWQKSEQVSLSMLLQWQTAWLMDVIKCRQQVDFALCQNQDLQTALQGLAKSLELAELYRFYNDLLNSQRLVDTQINKQLLLEQLLITWFNLHHR